MGKNKLKDKYLKINGLKKDIRKEIKSEEFHNRIKESIDSKYIKFINYKKDTLSFKANKKMRESIKNNDENFLETYMNEFISSLLSKDIDINSKELSILSNVSFFTSDNKIYFSI